MISTYPRLSILLLLAWLSLTSACALAPYAGLSSKESLIHGISSAQQKAVRKSGLEVIEIPGHGHSLLALGRLPTDGPSPVLNVYLEGDGRPWEDDGRNPAKNPSSRQALALQLMLKDPAPAIYLNRPCYGYSEMPQGCQASDWTSGRFSEDIVASMNAALNVIKEKYSVNRFWLIGHSGGGSLATLLAHQRHTDENAKDVDTLVTIAGNLDHRAWTRFHHYLSLDNSLNPVDVFPLPDTIERWHFAGKKDDVIPYSIFQKASAHDTGATIRSFKHFDHVCCWKKQWRRILIEIQKEN